MAGVGVTLCRRRVFDFGGVAASSSIFAALGRLPVGGAVEGTLLLRVHDRTISAGNEVELVARVTSPSAEDPTADFNEATSLASLSVTSSTGVPALLRASVDVWKGAELAIDLVATKGAGGGDLSTTLSADLVLKHRGRSSSLATERRVVMRPAAGDRRVDTRIPDDGRGNGLGERQLIPMTLLALTGKPLPSVILAVDDVDVSMARSVTWILRVFKTLKPQSLVCRMHALDRRAGGLFVESQPLATVRPGAVSDGRLFVVPLPSGCGPSVRMVVEGLQGAALWASAALVLQ